MSEMKQRTAAKQFAADWQGRGDEKQETQSFWLSLLSKVYGIDEPDKFIAFELPVKLSHTSFIDGFIESTRVLIEQKGQDIDLSKGAKQSDGSILTPYQQARRYAGYLPHDKNPRWIVVCNFREFHIHDMNRPNDEPEIVKLCNLEKEFTRLNFLVDTGDENIKKEMEISLQAGELVGVLYDALLKQYKDPESPETLKSLNALCVRLVFCLYAEDSGIFGKPNMFRDYLSSFTVKGTRNALIELFRVLDQKPEERDPELDDELLAFPYVNGGLFRDEDIRVPQFNEEIVDILLHRASEGFDWSDISPTIFGAVFESTLNPETRRSGGMHYTSIENIHKVIDPLFLDELRGELAEVKAEPNPKKKISKAQSLHSKLAELTFFDPACGSGNFLTETYLSLRRIENEILDILYGGQIVMGEGFNPIKVGIHQFYGIEINDFAVTVARTALWISEDQMMKQTEDIVHMDLNFLPLKSYDNIAEGNALRMNWEDVVPKDKLNYIMGNPPFVGARWMSKSQKSDVIDIFGVKWKGVGDLDYVCCWYKKATDLIKNTSIRAALVSTNSITQGGAVTNLWKPLMDSGVHIDFAHRTFRWDSEASIKAHVHCVIIGFSIVQNNKEKIIFDGNKLIKAKNINGYLLDTDNTFIEKRTKPISDVPEICLGGQPIDDGNYILSEEEKDELLKIEPQANEFIRPYMMGKDFINRKPRYCIWLNNANPSTLRQCSQILARVKAVKEFRLASQRTSTLKAAENPTLFGAPFECKSDYIAFPKVSSENRRYIPIDYLSCEIIPGDKLFTMQGASKYDFGVLTSNVHMAWMRAVCGRLKSDYSYSNTIVYNNFPWPNPTEEQKAKIEQTAQAILDARALYPDCSLADLYDEVTMPPELRKAHQQNDRAVMQAYGFSVKDMTESTCVAELMKMYQELTK